MKKLCSGCQTLEYIKRNSPGANCRYHNNEEKCPCIECIVKMICSKKNMCRKYYGESWEIYRNMKV